MGSSVYNNLVFKVQSLERKLNKITKGTRDNNDSSATMYSKQKTHYYESIQNLLELAKNIKHELRYSLKFNPENRKTLKMYNEVCVLESELYNLVNSIEPFQNTKVKPKVCESKDFSTVLRAEVPIKVSSDYSEALPRHYYRHYASFAPQELKTKICSDECFENITEPEYIVRRKSSSESFSSSESSSSTVTIVEKPFSIRKSNSSYRAPPSTNVRRRTPERIPVYIRKSKSSYRSPTSSVRMRLRTPERIPIYIKKTRGLSGRKREKRKRHKAITKKSSLHFGINKSKSNEINVHANDLQTQETEVFLIKKKGKPYSPREKSGKNSSSGRYFISRLKKVLSRERNKSPTVRKPSTPERRKEKWYVKKHSKNWLGISKYPENDPGSEGSSPQYREDRLNSDERRRKKSANNRSKKYTKSRRSHDSKPLAVARSSNFNNNPFHDGNQIFYLQDSSFVLFPKNLDSKDLYLTRGRGNGESYSLEDEAKSDRIYKKPVKISNYHKRNSISNTGSKYEILSSYQNSNFYLKENGVPPRTSELNSFKSSSKYKPRSETHENLQRNVAGGSINQYDSLHKEYGDYNSSMTKKYKNKEKSSEKLVLLKVVNDPIQLFEDKGSRKLSNRNLNNRGQNISLSGRLNKDNIIHYSPFGVSAVTEPSIYLTTIPQQLVQNNVQNPPSFNDRTQNIVERHDYIVNWGFGKKNKSKTSLNDTNSNDTPSSSSSPLKSSPSGKSMIAKNNNAHTLKKSGSKIFPVKASKRDINNSHAETKGTIPPLQNTRSLSRGLSLAGHQPTTRTESHTDVLKGVGSNQSVTGKKPKKWLQRSLSKLSIISKKSKKTKGEKDNKSLAKEASKSSLLDISKNGSTERQPSSEKISKAKSWTSFKRTMSGVGAGGLMKSGKKKNTEKQAALKKVKSENKLKKKPSLLKRLFSKSKTHLSNDTLAEISSSTGPINTSGYEGDKTSISSPPSVTTNHSLKTLNNTNLEGTQLSGYQIGSKFSKKGSNVNKGKYPTLLAPIIGKKKKQSLEGNPKAFNYSLHYSKVKHKCVEMDLVPSTLRLVDSSCPQTVDKTCSKNLWSMGETVLSERELSEFEKHNKYHEFIFNPNKCQGCTVHDKKITKSCKKRGEIKSFEIQPLNTVCNHDNDQLYNDPVGYFKSVPKTTSDHFLSDSSDFCDWKKIANEIKECR